MCPVAAPTSYENQWPADIHTRSSKRMRVTGPFTVESLSPHRTISAAEKKELAEVGRSGRTLKMYGPDKFGALVLENLRTAGVQNTFKNERLKVDSLQPYAAQWIHGEAHYTDSHGTNKRDAMSSRPGRGRRRHPGGGSSGM